MTAAPRRRSLLAALTGLAGLAGLVLALAVPPAAQAAFPGHTFLVRPADFVDPTGTVGGARMHVESDGVHLTLTAPTDLAAASFVVPDGGLPLYDFNMYGDGTQYTWTGSSAEPGIHYDIDLDGDGVADMELVGEHAYGDDTWLNTGFHRANPTVSLKRIQAAAPCRDSQPQRSLQDGCGSTWGGRFHGTVDDWRTGLSDAGYSGVVVKGGFVATGGLVDGVLGDMNIGIAHFRFTTDPRVPAQLTLTADSDTVAPGGTVDLQGTASGTYNYPDVIVQQRLPGGAWQDVDEQVLTRGGYFTSAQTAPDHGVVRYRAVIERSSINTRTVTAPVVVRVVRG